MSGLHFDPAVWPTALLFCQRNPLEHQARYRPYGSYPAGYTGVFGPPLRGDCRDRCECGALMYVAGARPWPCEGVSAEDTQP